MCDQPPLQTQAQAQAPNQPYLVIPKAAPPKKEQLSPEEAEEREIKLLTGILLSKKETTAREVIARVTEVLARKEKE